MPKRKEAKEEFHEIAEILNGWFPELYVDTSLRFREKKNERVIGESSRKRASKKPTSSNRKGA